MFITLRPPLNIEGMLASAFFLILTAANVVADADVNFHGTLVDVTCKINNDNPIDVNFGDAVGVSRVDGENYIQPIPLKIECSSPPGNLLRLVFYAQPTDFDAGAVETNNSDLGVKILSDGASIRINDYMPIAFDDIPSFSAVPVKRPGSKLIGGKFTAIATLIVRIE